MVDLQELSVQTVERSVPSGRAEYSKRVVIRNGRNEYFGVFKLDINDYYVRQVRSVPSSYECLKKQHAWCMNSRFDTVQDAVMAIYAWGN